MTNGSAAKYSIPSPPSNLYDADNNEDNIEDEDHYYRYLWSFKYYLLIRWKFSVMV